jgi:hypothetical protein
MAICLDRLTEAALWALALPWFVLGWLAGALAWLIVFVASALVAGYKAGYRTQSEEEG